MEKEKIGKNVVMNLNSADIGKIAVMHLDPDLCGDVYKYLTNVLPGLGGVHKCGIAPTLPRNKKKCLLVLFKTGDDIIAYAIATDRKPRKSITLDMNTMRILNPHVPYKNLINIYNTYTGIPLSAQMPILYDEEVKGKDDLGLRNDILKAI